jgi:hypothetical protein
MPFTTSGYPCACDPVRLCCLIPGAPVVVRDVAAGPDEDDAVGAVWFMSASRVR